MFTDRRPAAAGRGAGPAAALPPHFPTTSFPAGDGLASGVSVPLRNRPKHLGPSPQVGSGFQTCVSVPRPLAFYLLRWPPVAISRKIKVGDDEAGGEEELELVERFVYPSCSK